MPSFRALVRVYYFAPDIDGHYEMIAEEVPIDWQLDPPMPRVHEAAQKGRSLRATFMFKPLRWSRQDIVTRWGAYDLRPMLQLGPTGTIEPARMFDDCTLDGPEMWARAKMAGGS